MLLSHEGTSTTALALTRESDALLAHPVTEFRLENTPFDFQSGFA
jgi:hypothetical protein